MFATGITLLKELQTKIIDTSNTNKDVLTQALFHCLSLSHKCLNFEFIGVMLDDTLAENVGTHFPLTWRDTIQNLNNTNAFFEIAMLPNLSEDTYVLCLQCLSELASCRISLFESIEDRKIFTANFAQNLNILMKAQTENFCSSRLISRNYIKIFYKFEMNFQIRSFMIKELSGQENLKQYVEHLSELTLFLVKSGELYLRDTAVHLLAAWNRINIEVKSLELPIEEFVKTKINDIIVEFIEQNISDLSNDNEDEEDEQFNETELSSLTQRFDMIGRLCNIHIESTFSRLDEGLQFLMNKYQEELEKNNEETLEIIEKRFAWTIRVVTSLIGLGYAPKFESVGPTGPTDYDVVIKVIEIVKCNVDLLEKGTRKMDEKMELAILSFISGLRNSVLGDPRVVSKVTDNDEDTVNVELGNYLRIAQRLTSSDILGIVEIFFKKMILNFFSESDPILEQNLDMLRAFVGSPGTRKILMKLETTQDILENHFTKYKFLSSESTYEYLSGFYKILTLFWDVNDVIDDFQKYMKPCSEFLTNLLDLDANSFIQSKEDILRICYILTGVSQGFTNATSYGQFFDWFYPKYFRIIPEIFKHFCEDLTVLKGLFKLMRELLDNRSHRLKSDGTLLSGFLLFKEISSILLDYFKYVNMYDGKKLKMDKYEAKYQFIEMTVDIYGSVVAGNFINFATLEYYNDT